MGWNHAFNLSRPVTGRIDFTASSAINVTENEVLSRVNRTENWNAGLNVNVSRAVGMGIKFNRNVQRDVRNENKPNEVKSFREKESVSLSSNYRKTHLSGIDVSAGISAGLEKNEYADVKNTGLTQGVQGAIQYEPLPTFKTAVSYNGGHSLLDSKQGALESSDESSDHSLSGRAEYDWSTHSFAVDLRRHSSSKEYPKEQQTERRDQTDRDATVRADFRFLSNITANLSYAYSSSRTSYALESTRDSDMANRAVDASLGYTLGGTRYTAELKSEKKRNDYFNFQSGNVDHQSLGGSISHDFTDRFGVVVRGRMSLLSYQYDDIDENDQDRDLFDREGTLNLTYRSKGGIETGLLLRLKQNELIYIRRSRTGDNKTTQKYTVQPSITKAFGGGVKVTQKYELAADYTFYDYDRDSNFLIRDIVVSTGVSWNPVPQLMLSVDHRHRSQDEGSYVEDESGVERYGKNSEREDKSVGITVKYKLLNAIDIEASQSYSLQTKWRFDEGEREFAWEKFDTRLTGKASMKYDVDKATKLELSIARTLRDATNVTERQKDVWKITGKINKAF